MDERRRVIEKRRFTSGSREAAREGSLRCCSGWGQKSYQGKKAHGRLRG